MQRITEPLICMKLLNFPLTYYLTIHFPDLLRIRGHVIQFHCGKCPLWCPVVHCFGGNIYLNEKDLNKKREEKKNYTKLNEDQNEKIKNINKDAPKTQRTLHFHKFTFFH